MNHQAARPDGAADLTRSDSASKLLLDGMQGRISRRDFARRAAVLGAGTSGLATFLAACGGSEKTGGDAAGAADVALPATAVVAQVGPVVGLDPDGSSQANPPSRGVFLAGYDALTIYRFPISEAESTAKLKEGVASMVVPCLAESWEKSSNGKTYRFKLREGVTSHAGNTMTADDVVWSNKKSFASGAGGAFVLGVIGKVGGPDSITAVDDMTVEYKLTEASDWILLALGFYIGGSPVIHDSVEAKKHATSKDPYAQKWLNENLAGFGPYKIVEKDSAGNSVTLEAREDYWGEERVLKRVVQRSVPESGSRLQLLLTGESVLAYGLDPTQLDKVDASPRAKVVHIDCSTASFLPLTEEGVWGQSEVRQAIAKTIPYKDILTTVFRDRAKPYQSVLLPYLPGFTNEYAISQDLEAARAVLSSIKDPLTLTYSAASATDEQIALLIKTAMQQAGFDLTVQKQPGTEFDTKRFAGGNEFWVDSIATPGVAAVSYYIDLYTGDKKTVGFYNFFSYQDDEMDSLAATIHTGSEAEVLAATKKAQEIFMRDLPMIPIAWTGFDHGVTKALDIPFAYSGNGVAEWRDLVKA